MKTKLLWTYFGLYIGTTVFKKMKLESLKKKNDEQEQKQYIQKVVLRWANSVVDAVGIKINVIGKENIPDVNCLFVANHQSNADIPVMLSALDKTVGFIAKKEMEKIPLVSYWMREIKCIFMDRDNIRESIKSINEGVEILKQGDSLVIFPEGTRSKNNIIGEFKKGSMKLGTKAGVPIVPVAICGSYKALEGNNNKFRKAKVNVIIHKPIQPELLSKEEQNNLSETIREIIISSYQEA